MDKNITSYYLAVSRNGPKKMAADHSKTKLKTFGIQIVSLPMLFGMVGIIAIPMAIAMRSPTTPNQNHPKSDCKIVQYWDGVWYSEFGFRAPTVIKVH